MIHRIKQNIAHDGTLQVDERDFPYMATSARLISDANNCPNRHYHEDFEFGVVENGRMLLDLSEQTFILETGDGYFVNSNTIHACRPMQGEAQVHVHTQLFDRRMITGIGIVNRRYVSPLEKCIGMDGFVLRASKQEHAVILDNLKKAYTAAEKDEEGFELHICANLNLAWAWLYQIVKPLFEENEDREVCRVSRARLMLAYIHQNYDKPITLSEIVRISGVGERECFRWFARYFNTSPMEYLSRYRIAMAARMLEESTLQINQIAERCGFSTPSYFGLVFRKQMGKTPREYRQEMNQKNMCG